MSLSSPESSKDFRDKQNERDEREGKLNASKREVPLDDDDEPRVKKAKKDVVGEKESTTDLPPRNSEEKDREVEEKGDREKLKDDAPKDENKRTETQKDASSCGTPSDLSSGSSRGPVGDNSAESQSRSVDNTALVAEHYNALEERGLSHRSQSRIVYMRNFNNWIKSMLINEYLEKTRQGKNHGAPLKVLDMCCGKGGDLLKWRKANITHLICADIAGMSVEQCQHRYNEMLKRNSDEKGFAPLFTAEFLTADCTKVRLREKYKDASMQLDFVSCQFAFHYSFESLPQAECMLRNASESLRQGGYFVGTIPDAYDLVSRWQKTEGNKFGNDVFTVEFVNEDRTKPPLFGAKYDFHLEGVVDCPEFLVHLPTLKELALKFGLELVMFERFEDYYERMKNEGRSLLSKMQALETYPPYHEAPLFGSDSDYEHARQYMQTSTGHRKVGTLSSPEWEATSLYAVFAFQKLKTSWNNEGMPVYSKP